MGPEPLRATLTPSAIVLWLSFRKKNGFLPGNNAQIDSVVYFNKTVSFNLEEGGMSESP
jgi:hypothetical protein